MRKLDVWHLAWVLVLIVGVLLLAVTLGIAYYQRENSSLANFSSIGGLFVGLIGFIVTIYTLFETQRVSRKAQEEIQAATVAAQQKIEEAVRQAQEAVKSAQAQTRQVLERVRYGIRDADFATLQMWVRELRSAAARGDWSLALFFAEECPRIAERLRNAEGLETEERQGLGEGTDNLRLVQTYLRNNRLNSQTPNLPTSHAKKVETLAALLERLGGRLHHEPTREAIP